MDTLTHALIGYLGFQINLQQQAKAIGKTYLQDHGLTQSTV